MFNGDNESRSGAAGSAIQLVTPACGRSRARLTGGSSSACRGSGPARDDFRSTSGFDRSTSIARPAGCNPLDRGGRRHPSRRKTHIAIRRPEAPLQDELNRSAVRVLSTTSPLGRRRAIDNTDLPLAPGREWAWSRTWRHAVGVPAFAFYKHTHRSDNHLSRSARRRALEVLLQPSSLGAHPRIRLGREESWPCGNDRFIRSRGTDAGRVSCRAGADRSAW